MVRWEYLSEAIGSDDLAQRGLEGWELAAMGAGVMIYKRPIDEKAAAAAAKAEAAAAEPEEAVAEEVIPTHTTRTTRRH